jgi:hypothetical protein
MQREGISGTIFKAVKIRYQSSNQAASGNAFVVNLARGSWRLFLLLASTGNKNVARSVRTRAAGELRFFSL